MTKAKDMEEPYDLEIEELCRTISEKGYKRILLQFPEGLKGLAPQVKDEVENKTGADVFIHADTCYGACDLPDIHGTDMDLVVQYGHSEMKGVRYPVPTMFIEAYSTLDVIPAVEKSLSQLKGTVGLVTTVQHINQLPKVKELLEKEGFKVVIGKGANRTIHNGQVLGCSLSSATSISGEVDCFLFIGSGNFHPIGVAMATQKPVVIADPYANEVREVEELKNRLLRQRHGAITRAGEAVHVGILVSGKPGQQRLKLAANIKSLAEKYGKKAYVLLLNEIHPDKLSTFKMDAYISTACPRIAMDDYHMYSVPILTPYEFRIAVGEALWESYRYDEFM
ncbi:MAG: diphthamide biosynthesis enzyme Dph2 [Thermoplasmata archaeon]|nr:MAG: diphthamide biosynthesis enzyme Dph2 [Thermoplasmata archaeon]